MVMFFSVVMLFNSSTDIGRRQDGKYKCLHKSHDQFYSHHKKSKRYSHKGTNYTSAQIGAGISKYKNKTYKTQNRNVTC